MSAVWNDDCLYYYPQTRARELEAAAAAVCVMGLAGKSAGAICRNGEGNSTYRNHVIDAIYQMDEAVLNEGKI